VGPLTTTLHKKTVTISWAENLAENTTYILQLNGTVRDVNEGNDSIMQLVFATGPKIDSAFTKGKVIDAFTNEAIQGATVGLYLAGSDPFNEQAYYAARSNNKGIYSFSFIKDQPYQLIAFQDRNKNQQIDPDEPFGFVNDYVSAKDSLQKDLRLYLPENPSKKTKIQPILPGLMAVSGYQISDQSIRMNGVVVSPSKIVSKDSILLKIPDLTESLVQVIVGKDTLQKNIQPKERNKASLIRMDGKNILALNDSLFFRTNLIADRLQKEKISITNVKNEAINFQSILKGDQLILIPSPAISGSLRIHFEPAVLSDGISLSDSCSFAVQFLAKNEMATLQIDASALSGTYVVELVEGQKVIAKQYKKTEQTSVTFESLVPGNYSIRCIADVNGNGIWDAGSYPAVQPEKVLRFPIRQKLKGNWVIEEVLKLE
jgi:uncharacterized protein (DUF2141 family)